MDPFSVQRRLIGPNDVVVSNTLLVSASAAIYDGRLGLGDVYNLARFVEALVLHDRLVTYDLPLAPHRSGALHGALVAKSLLLKLGDIDIDPVNARAVSMYRELIATPSDRETLAHNIESLYSNHRDLWPGPTEVWKEPAALARRFIRITPEYFDQLAADVRFHNYSGNDIVLWVMNTLRYIVMNDALGVSFYPSFERLPYLLAMRRRLNGHISELFLQRVERALDSHWQSIRSHLHTFALPAPYLLVRVLRRATSASTVLEAILEEREAAQATRDLVRELEDSLRTAPTLKAAMKTRRIVHQHLLRLIGAKDVSVKRIIGESVPYADLAAELATGQGPTEAGAGLLAKPVTWLIDWWKRRRLAYLVSIPNGVSLIMPIRDDIRRLWGLDLSEQDERGLYRAQRALRRLILLR